MSHVPSFGRCGLAALSLVAMLAGVSCNSSTSQQDARDRATAETCARLTACGQVGSGKTYATADDCTTKWRSNWQTTWPPPACDGQINENNLEICLTAIHSTDCMSGLDALDTASKCTQAKVCSGSTADGGP
jgi:hypothetical protein